ncbi:MAG TPA: DUF3754 domain-containing protein [Methyloceanibacter sp.]
MQALVDRVPSQRAGGVEKRASVTSKILDLPGLTATPESQHFIPVSRHGLRARLIAMLKEDGGGEREWDRALDCLAAWRHQFYRKRLLELIDDYLPFSPDSDTVNLIELDAATRQKAQAEFIEGVEELLAEANYVRLSPEDLQRLLIARSPHGLYLDVDMSDFDEVLLYFRGASTETREERNPWRFYLTKDRYKVHLFQRLFLLLKLKPTERRAAEIMAATGASSDRARRMVAHQRRHLPVGVSSEHIYVKVFKHIPQIDLEMLFPNTRIEFRPFDKLRLLVTAGGGTAAGVVGMATKLLAAANPITLAGGLVGLSAVIFRQVMSFFNTRNHYMMLLAQNLYFCSLANNRGALTLIADSAEEEDVKEDMLLYALLARRPSHGDALAEIKSAIERFVAEHCGATINFDAEDALRRLLADGLVRVDAAGNLTAIGPEEARAHLDLLWDRLLDVDTLDHAAPSGTA